MRQIDLDVTSVGKVASPKVSTGVAVATLVGARMGAGGITQVLERRTRAHWTGQWWVPRARRWGRQDAMISLPSQFGRVFGR